MSSDQKITSDDLFKLSASLSIVGYSLALLALEKADEEDKQPSEGQGRSGKKQTKVVVNRLIRRFNG